MWHGCHVEELSRSVGPMERCNGKAAKSGCSSDLWQVNVVNVGDVDQWIRGEANADRDVGWPAAGEGPGPVSYNGAGSCTPPSPEEAEKLSRQETG